MKRIYQAPSLRYIAMENEGDILNASFRVDATQETEDRFTQKKEQDLWGNESVWK